MADEINRASPRTQSALLQAMQEHRVAVAGEIHALPAPFHVLATQNPIEQEGTYPLPEAQLDRFLLEVEVSYPDAAAERAMLLATTGAQNLRPVQAMTGAGADRRPGADPPHPGGRGRAGRHPAAGAQRPARGEPDRIRAPQPRPGGRVRARRRR